MASLEQDLEQAIAAEGATQISPVKAWDPPAYQSVGYIFDSKKWTHQNEDVLVFTRKEDVPADSQLGEAVNSIAIDWGTEALVAVLSFPQQHIYRYATKGDEFILFAGRAKPCAGYEDIAGLYAYQVDVYRVPGVARGRVVDATRTYRFNPIRWEKRCTKTEAVVAGAGNPCVIRDGGRYHMWFEGFSAMTGNFFDSWSDDRVQWAPSGWDSAHVSKFEKHSGYADHYSPSVLKVGDGYWLYYSNIKFGPGGSQSTTISRSVSPDGLEWKDERVVLEPGGKGQWDESWLLSPVVVRSADGRNWMWYAGWSAADRRPSIGLATSDDGLTWQRSPDNPVLGPGAVGSFEDLGVANPEIQLQDGTFHLWYSGWTGGGSPAAPARGSIGYATSSDGVHWERHAEPLLGPTTGAEGDSVFSPGAMIDGKDLWLWYTSLNVAHEPVVSLARCPL